MNAKQMREQVLVELGHIPKGNLDQSLLRMAYEVARLNSLGGRSQVGGTRGDVLRFSVAQVRRGSPGAPLAYDAVFFA